jgi:hypothetical protein
VKAATSGGWVAPSVATTKGARKGGSKGLKWCPCHIAVAVSNNGGDEEVGDSDEECVAAAERDFKHQTRPPKDHFEKLLKAAYPHHSYPIKHKLKDCTMMKNFMMSGALSKGRRPRESPGGKGHGTPQLAAVRDLGDVMSGEMEPMPDPNPCRAKDGGDMHESVETPEIVSP